jgi:hypothetical protein
MTNLLQQAIFELQKLPDTQQDAMASIILDELADEAKWSSKFAESQDKLAAWANKVRGDIDAGRFQDKGIDEL